MRVFLVSMFSICISLFTFAFSVHAQTSQILSVTPPLFQISVLPEDVWQSSVKVVNGNPYPMTVYAEVVNFEADGESGRGRFLPLIHHDEETGTLAEWINVPKGPYTVEPESSADISFVVKVPKNAAPGGHYAAILISTEPPQTQGETLAVKTSQAVTSLFFARIEGDIEEIGTIREFRAVKRLLQKPSAEFSLRFENKGNVHLQPRGDIVISNMWGTERGRIPINYQTHFGNVLPESIRDFKFVWERELSFTDVGRYTARVTLAYGEEGVKSTSYTAHFWVIPMKITLITILSVVSFIWVITLIVRAYVRRMLTLAGVPLETDSDDDKEYERPHITYAKVSAPIKTGVLDLRTRLTAVEETFDMLKIVGAFMYTYRMFFVSVTTLVLIFIVAVMYVARATERDLNYRVIIDEGDAQTTLEGSAVREITDTESDGL